jgi:hypothetical protein
MGSGKDRRGAGRASGLTRRSGRHTVIPEMRTKRTYNLPERTVRTVRELAASYGVADTQDGVIELAVDELARRLREDAEAEQWAAAADDQAFIAESADVSTAYASADRETWPSE